MDRIRTWTFAEGEEEKRREEKQKTIEYSEVLSYIISMRNKEFFPVLINTAETRRPL